VNYIPAASLSFVCSTSIAEMDLSEFKVHRW
jgi:hypothetical protein